MLQRGVAPGSNTNLAQQRGYTPRRSRPPPIETTLRALDDLVHQGKVRAIGCSNYAAWQVCKALWVSDVRNLARFEVVQPPYNLLSRGIEDELLPLCAAEQLGIVTYNPTGVGILAGRYQWGKPPEGSRFQRVPKIGTGYWYAANFEIVERLKPIAAQTGRSLGQLAFAWVLDNPAITSVLTGVESVGQLEENLAAAERPLTEEEYQAVTTAGAGAVVGPAEGPRWE
ncbi:MAG: aldo/keto reductase [Bacteroidetes bacterium]|nr:aldo/keto reductase [Bacteroidota bacterium]MCL5025093.1 aldo/keto reductase [Chloroflexota bacterium]